MWPFNTTREAYEPVADREQVDGEEGIEDVVEEKAGSHHSQAEGRWTWIAAGLVLLAAFVAAVGTVWIVHSTDGTGVATTTTAPTPAELPASIQPTTANNTAIESPASTTPRCGRRREWRTLSDADKQHYISSVKCLLTIPSKLHPNSSAYEDFPLLHSRVGHHSHNSAPFLPWHRYFLHIYERTLRDECGFRGEGLVYWDWTLDWEHLERAPVFDAATGFGGDGETGGESTVGNSGRCVVDGPFAGVRANFYDTKPLPHCLSRGFRDDDGRLGVMDGRLVSPENIERVLSHADYEALVKEMESKIHDTIPFGVGGDFETFTAPYDPLFFLHHVQLDRLWYLWVQRDPETRRNAYGGHAGRRTMKMAQLTDKIHIPGLAPDVEVRELMDTQGDLLCYTY